VVAQSGKPLARTFPKRPFTRLIRSDPNPWSGFLAAASRQEAQPILRSLRPIYLQVYVKN